MIRLIVRILFMPLRLIRRIQLTFVKLSIRYHGRDAALKKAIAKADKKHKETGYRYRVVFLGRRYRVLCRNDVREYKKGGVFNYFINSTALDNIAYYDTHQKLQPCT